MELKGLFELESALKEISKNKGMEKYNDIFSKQFMMDNTHFDNIEDLFYFGGIEIKPLEEYSTVDMWMMDEAVDKYTDFPTWDDFIKAALENNS